MTTHTARTRRDDWRARAASGLATWLAVGMAAPLPALAGPEDANVVRGDVQIENLGDTTTIRASDRSIIEFGSFDIGVHETVQFIQPSETASVLNRIRSSQPTLIEGALLANGRVYLVNPAGVYFSENARIDVAHLIASAGQISNEDFLAGIDHFTDVSGTVSNAGQIHADVVSLIGRYVSNSGSISAPGGLILLAAGEDVLVGEPGSRLYLKLEAEAPADPARAGVEQSGSLEAAGGSISLAAGDLYGVAIHHSGTSQADEVLIAGGETGLVEVKGTLDASDDAPGGVGGRVEVTGEKIALRGATIDASGDAGGGVILVGGDFQGQGETRTAEQTFVDPDSELKADARSQGDGGKVIVWADGTTGFHGAISARGGAVGGDGGLVEVSGKDTLFFRGDVDTRAPAGRTGNLLLDPVNLTIANGVGDGAADGTGTFAGDPSGTTGVVLPGDTAPVTIFESELEGLAASTNVALSATNNLTVSNLSDNLLALPTTGSVAFTAGNAFSMDAGDTIRTQGAALSITGATVALGSLDTRGASGTLGGNISVNSTGAGSTLTVRDIRAGTANVTLSASSGASPGFIVDDGNTATRIGGAVLTLNTGTGGAIGNALAPIGTDITGRLDVNKLGGGALVVSELSGLVIGAIQAGAGSTTSLTAEAGSILDDGNAGTVIAGNLLSLRAPGGAIGTAGTPIRASLNGATGRIDATAANGVFYTQTLNNLRVGAIDAGTGDAALVALVGAMVDDNNAATQITANNLLLQTTAAAGVPFAIGTAANPIAMTLNGTLTINRTGTGAAGIFATETNDMRIGIINAPGGPISLTSTGGSIVDDGVAGTVINGADTTLTANGPGAGIGTSATPILMTLAEVPAPPNSGLQGTPRIFSASAPNGGGIFVRNSDDLKLGAINAGTGAFSLAVSPGRILDDDVASTVISASSLALSASGQDVIIVNGTPVATIPHGIGPLITQNVASLTASAAGTISIRNATGSGDITLGPISSTQGGFALRNDVGGIVVDSPISVSSLAAGTLALDTPYAIDLRVASLQAGGGLALNSQITPDQIVEPRLATIFVTPGTSGDPVADARNLTLGTFENDFVMGAGQSISVPGTLTINAPNRRATLGDVSAVDFVLNADVASLHLRGPKSVFRPDGSLITDTGGDVFANTIALNIGSPMGTLGSGAPPLFATLTGAAVANAPANARFGRSFSETALVPADFLGVGGAAAGEVLDLFAVSSSTAGSPDAVAPIPWPVGRRPIQLSQLNAAAAGDSYLRGADLLAYLRCSNAPGDDPDQVPVDCLGYSAKDERAPFGTPEAASARARYRELYTGRGELRARLGAALEAYRASGQGAPGDGAAFRRFLEQDRAQAEAQDALLRLQSLMRELDGLMGGGREPGQPLEYWRQQLLEDFLPEGMSAEQLDEAIGGPAPTHTAGLAAQ
jgi:filamentous hemagglutinin family protein